MEQNFRLFREISLEKYGGREQYGREMRPIRELLAEDVPGG